MDGRHHCSGDHSPFAFADVSEATQLALGGKFILNFRFLNHLITLERKLLFQTISTLHTAQFHSSDIGSMPFHLSLSAHMYFELAKLKIPKNKLNSRGSFY